MAASFAEAVVKFTADPGGLSKQLAAIERSVGQAAERMAAGFKTAFLGLSGALVGAGGTIAALTKISADVGDELAKMSQRVAISVETLSGYRLAADLADVSLQDFGTSLQRASRNIADAAKGTGEAADAFDALGIRVTDGSGRLKTAEQVMLEVAEKFARMEDGAQKTALAMDIFGKGGASMIPLLNQGSAALAAQRQEAEQLGATWTGAQAKLAEAFNDSFTRLKAALAGFRNAVSTYLFPFFTNVVESILAKIKEWGADGTLKIWALSIGEAILGAFAKAAEGIAAAVKLIPYLADAFKWVAAQVSYFGAVAADVISGILEGIRITTRAIEKIPVIGPRMAKDLGEVRGELDAVRQTLGAFAESSRESGKAWEESMGQPVAWVEHVSAGADAAAEKIREWGASAIATASQALAGISEKGASATGQIAETLTYQVDGVTKTIEVMTTTAGQLVLRTAKEQAKALEESFKVLQTRGEASLADVRDYLEQRAQLFRAGSQERIQAEAEAYKFAKDMADQLFAHQKAMGLASLQDEIEYAKQKAAAAKVGSAERMKAEEDVFKKEEELRTKRQSAALGILGKVKERLEAKGYTEEDVITRDMVEREMADLRAEEARAAAKAQRFAAGGGETLADIIAGYQAAGSLNQAQAQQRELGGVGDILAGGAQVGAGPLTRELGRLGAAITAPDFAQGYGDAMDAAVAAVDTGLGKIEERVNQSSSRVAQTIYGNIEEYLVRRIMSQLDRN